MAYIQLGWGHIITKEAIDHLLFLLLLILPLYQMRFLILVKLVTAFTIGHAITIFISLGDLPDQLIYVTELLIPVTIIITGIISLIQPKSKQKIALTYYLLVGVFGLIHGLGFAASIKSMMMGEASVIVPLLQFNVGVELGQVLVLAGIVFCMKCISVLAKKTSTIQYFELLKKGMALVGIFMAVWMVWGRM